MKRALSIGLTLWTLAAMAAWFHLEGPTRWLPGAAFVLALLVLAVVAARGPRVRVELRHVERAPTHLDLTLAVSSNRALSTSALDVMISGWRVVDAGGVWGPGRLATTERVRVALARTFTRGDGWVGVVRVPLAQPLASDLEWVVEVDVTTTEGKTVHGRVELPPA